MMTRDTKEAYRKRLDDLFQLEFFGMKLGLENIRAILHALGNPERKFPAIHIAGTNGKGSVASMLSAIHTADGRKTGLYTSPHLVDFRERIRIDGVMIEEGQVLEFLERVWPVVLERKATFFEVTTALAFDHFANEHIDIAIVETGLGGRLDATNVLEAPLASVITSIGMDHMAQLGPTLEAIASEKAGIIKRSVPAVVNCSQDLEWVFVQYADRVGAPLSLVREFHVPENWHSLGTALQGHHQQENLLTVLATLAQMDDRPSDNAIRNGLANAAAFTGLRGRLEEYADPHLLARGVRVLLDVAHNAPAMKRIAEYFQEARIRPIVVLGLMQDKAIEEVLQTVGGFAAKLIAVSPESKRAMHSDELAERALRLGQSLSEPGASVLRETQSVGSVVRGFELATAEAKQGDTILMVGSHFVLGDFLKNYRTLEVV